MSKRFTETEKWRDGWFRKLTPTQKCFWSYLCDNCDQSGVIDIDFELASFQIGDEVSARDLVAFDRQLHRLDNGKLMIRGFIRFQYGTLSEDCKPHKPVFACLQRHGISLENLIEIQSKAIGKAIEAYPVGYESLQDKEKDKDKDKDISLGLGLEEKTEVLGKPQTDAEFLKALSENSGYSGIDVYREFDKMVAWCKVSKKQPTRRRFVNWLNRIEAPITAGTRDTFGSVRPNLGAW